MSLDYSQIELRIVAHMAQDKKMIEAFRNGQDIHERTATLIGITRRQAKALNFGIIYGMGTMGFARNTGLDRTKARAFIDAYLTEFSGVAKYMEDTKAQAHRDGFVQTLFGRKREIPEIKSTMPQLQAAGERMAINMPIQGTAADLIKMAMVKIYDEIKGNNDIRMLYKSMMVGFEIKDLVPNITRNSKRLWKTSTNSTCRLS